MASQEEEPQAEADALLNEESAAATEGGAQPGMEELPPDHPLLQRAQEALFQQLSATKLRLEEELREKKQALKAR